MVQLELSYVESGNVKWTTQVFLEILIYPYCVIVNPVEV